jgi:mRNA-degrading endonuclease toxin of MazEF toxin-antitoxin module
MTRGDVALVRFPHPSGQRGKKRPAVVIQSDAYASTVKTLVVAEVTKNLAMKDDPACLFIDVSTP